MNEVDGIPIEPVKLNCDNHVFMPTASNPLVH